MNGALNHISTSDLYPRCFTKSVAASLTLTVVKTSPPIHTLGDAIVTTWWLFVTEERNKGEIFLPFLPPWRRKRWWEQCIPSPLKAQISISILIIKLKLSACSEVRDFSFMFPFGMIPPHSGRSYFPDFKVQSFTAIMSLAFLIHKLNATSSPCLWNDQL